MQGMGRHSMEEVMERMDADLAACETLLEDSGAFLTGATPTQADCFLYGLLDHVRCHHTSAPASSVFAFRFPSCNSKIHLSWFAFDRV